MAGIIIFIGGLWFFGSLIVCIGLCRAAAEADRKAEQHRLAILLGVQDPHNVKLGCPSQTERI